MKILFASVETGSAVIKGPEDGARWSRALGVLIDTRRTARATPVATSSSAVPARVSRPHSAAPRQSLGVPTDIPIPGSAAIGAGTPIRLPREQGLRTLTGIDVP